MRQKSQKKPYQVKETNPKDSIGVKKWGAMSLLPWVVIWELSSVMLEGARKYGGHNYRVAGVRNSVYTDAAFRHLTQFLEGEDIDPESDCPHLVKAMACLMILRDAQLRNMVVDDRPPRSDVPKLVARNQAMTDFLWEKIPDPKPRFVDGDQFIKDPMPPFKKPKKPRRTRAREA